MESRFTALPDAWDLALDTGSENPVNLMLVRTNGVAMWEGAEAPALATQPSSVREQAVQWRNGGLGAGISIRLPETSGQGPDGQILSLGYSHGEFLTTVVDGIAMPSGKLTQVDLPAQVASASGRIFSAEDYGGYLFFSTGNQYAIRVNNATGVIDTQDFGASATTGVFQVFDGDLVMSSPNGALWRYDGTIWEQGTIDTIRSRLAKVYWNASNQLMGGSGGGTGAYRLIGTDQFGTGFFHISEGDDVLDPDDWVSVGGDPIPVTDTFAPIQNIISSGDVVWFATPYGLIGVNELGRTKNLTPWFARTYHASNGGVVDFYSDENQSMVFISHQQGLVAVNTSGAVQDTARFVQFGSKGPNLTPIWGRPRWFTATIDGLFVAYFDGTDSYIMRLIFEKDGSYRWSGPEAVIRDEEVTYLRVASPGGKPRLWIGTITNSGSLPHLYWQSLPESGNPYVDWISGTDHRFATSWIVYPPREDYGSSAKKVLRRYDIVAKNLDAGGGTVVVAARADDNDDGYVTQGTAAVSPRASFTATTYTSGVNFNWRLSVTNSETQPVILESFQARASVLPEEAPVWNFRCQLAPAQGLLNDAEDIEDPFTTWLRVRGLQRRGPISMRSPLSREMLTAKVEQPTPIQMVWSDRDAAHVMTMVVTVSVLNMPVVYDAGFPWDSGGEYGGP